jgi:hypothetical protein
LLTFSSPVLLCPYQAGVAARQPLKSQREQSHDYSKGKDVWSRILEGEEDWSEIGVNDRVNVS